MDASRGSGAALSWRRTPDRRSSYAHRRPGARGSGRSVPSWVSLAAHASPTFHGVHSSLRSPAERDSAGCAPASTSSSSPITTSASSATPTRPRSDAWGGRWGTRSERSGTRVGGASCAARSSPLHFTTHDAAWIPNYSLHLIGLGQTYASLDEFYRQHGVPLAWPLAALTALGAGVLNEMAESNGASFLRRPPWSTTGTTRFSRP